MPGDTIFINNLLKHKDNTFFYGFCFVCRCSESIIGQNLKDCSDLRSICSLDSDGKPEKSCQFCPYVPNFTKASIMGHQWLDSVGIDTSIGKSLQDWITIISLYITLITHQLHIENYR